MSLHLLHCAAVLPLTRAEKLVLLCLAENANSRDAIAFPGQPAMMAWSGLGKTQLYAVLRALVELRLIEQTRPGNRGGRAEYVVFPYGCCAGHGKDEAWTDAPDDDGPNGSALTEPSTDEEGFDSDAIGFGAEPDPSDACGEVPGPNPSSANGFGPDDERVRSDAETKGSLSPNPPQDLPRTTVTPETHLPLQRHDARDLDTDDETRSAVVA